MFKNVYWKKINKFLIIMAFTRAIISLLYIYFIGTIIRIAFNGEANKLIIWISISAFLFFLDILFGFIEKRTLSKLIPSYKNKMRMTFLGNWFNIIQKRKARLGQINNALQNDIPTVTNMKIESIYSLTYSIVTFVVIISFLFWLHWILGVATLLSLLILGILPLIISKKLEEINFTISKNNEEFYGKSVNINKNKDQYIFTRKLGKYHKSILTHVDNYYLKNIKLTLVLNSIWQFLYFLADVFFMLPIIVGSILMNKGNVNIGTISILVFLSEKILTVGDRFSDGLSSIFLSKKIKNKYKLTINNEIKTIEFINVVPLEGERHLTRKPLNIKIEPGKNYLFLGKNGAGKSSLLNIFDTNLSFNGNLKINGIEINKEQINNFYFSRPNGSSTIFESIDEIEKHINITNNKVYKNIRNIILDSGVLSSAKHGYSQGEIQLLSLLHVLANKSSIILLDETLTSVQKTLKNNIYQALMTEKVAVILIDHTLEEEIKGGFDEIILF